MTDHLEPTMSDQQVGTYFFPTDHQVGDVVKIFCGHQVRDFLITASHGYGSYTIRDAAGNQP